VPGTDGRAGMAALVADEGFDLAGLSAHLAGRLPDYARPLFLRLVDDLEATETFKQKKQGLIEQGFDPGVVTDPLYFADPETKAPESRTYVRLDRTLFEAITAGQLRP